MDLQPLTQLLDRDLARGELRLQILDQSLVGVAQAHHLDVLPGELRLARQQATGELGLLLVQLLDIAIEGRSLLAVVLEALQQAHAFGAQARIGGLEQLELLSERVPLADDLPVRRETDAANPPERRQQQGATQLPLHAVSQAEVSLRA